MRFGCVIVIVILKLKEFFVCKKGFEKFLMLIGVR